MIRVTEGKGLSLRANCWEVIDEGMSECRIMDAMIFYETFAKKCRTTDLVVSESSDGEVDARIEMRWASVYSRFQAGRVRSHNRV